MQPRGLSLPGVFIIGTDTEVGKTYQACRLARCLRERYRVGVYKPVASGVTCAAAGDAMLPSDAQLLRAAANAPQPVARVCPQAFRAAVAPPVAAEMEDRRVDDDLLLSGGLWWQGECDFLIVEGAGGGLSPLSESQCVLDLAALLALPIILVAANRLGVVNHTLLTIEAVQARGLSLVGVVLNTLPQTSEVDSDTRLAQQSNARLLRHWAAGQWEIVDTIEALVPRLPTPDSGSSSASGVVRD